VGHGREWVDEEEQSIKVSLGNHCPNLCVPAQKPAFKAGNVQMLIVTEN